MNFWQLPRIPESEEMDAEAEVSSYSSAAAETHLDQIDNTLVEHVLRLLLPHGFNASAGIALDIGTGPAQIPIKLLQRLPGLHCIGLDQFPNMLACGRENAVRGGVSERLTLVRGDAHALPFPNGVFSIVLCNSVMHHARNPVAMLREIFRVAAPTAAVLVRDLRRPSRLLLQWHLWRHGCQYRGEMRRLFEASVKAAYTAEELEGILRQAGTRGASIFKYRGAHIGIERAGS